MTRATVSHSKSTDRSLQRYDEKRDFNVTSEPKAKRRRAGKTLTFVVQKHWASHLHYDFRLEHGGVLWSWAVPKGPCFDPKTKRMAIRVEDHPVDYAAFEGSIPAKQYGAGRVIIWDRGTWEPVGDPDEGMKLGKLLFKIHGEKLAGLWELVRISKPDSKQDQWMLFKKKDEWQRPLGEYDVLDALPDSLLKKPLGLLEDRVAPVGQSKASKSSEPKGAESSAADMRAAVKCKLPQVLKPQLATLSKEPPPEGDWIYEIKFDGYRIMARMENGKATLLTRGGHDWTQKMQPLAHELEASSIRSGFLDGELVVLDKNGKPDFGALQQAFDGSRTAEMVYFVFDLPFFDDSDLRGMPLIERKKVLRRLLEANVFEKIRYTEEFRENGAAIFKHACEMGLEGIIAKRRLAKYVSDRNTSWLKLKCLGRQEFVIVGFTDRANTSREVGGMLLGYYANKQLVYAGNVGTGWTSSASADLHKQLVVLETKAPPIDSASIKPGRWSKRPAGKARWVKPQLVAEIAFTEWTADGHLRHPSFKGLRADKSALEVVRESPEPAASASNSASALTTPKPIGAKSSSASSARPKATTRKASNNATAKVGKTAISHGERVIDVASGLTKLDLVQYYQFVAPFMLPHLANRPVSLVRAPAGVKGPQFFQKHDEKLSIPEMEEFPKKLWPEHGALLKVASTAALVSAAQMNVIEFHTWNATAKNLSKPDRMIFDLDPGEGVPWEHMLEAASLTRALLAQLGLESWVKTSGGKGFHIVVPLSARTEFELVKGFSQAIVQHLARTIPSRFVAKSGASNRVGKIFIDWLRNGQSQTTAAAFSARARPGLGVSMPIAWEALDSIRSGADWNISNTQDYLASLKEDPWHGYWTSRQTITKAMKLLGYPGK